MKLSLVSSSEWGVGQIEEIVYGPESARGRRQRGCLRAEPMREREGGAVIDSKDERTKLGTGTRLGLLLLAASALPVGLWASLAPRSFYEDFPAAGRHWVSSLPPYNEHLITDVGAGYLGLGTLLASAALLLGRNLVRVSLVSWLAFAVPHFAFHFTTLNVYSFLDNALNMTGLGLAVLLPLVLLAGTYRRPKDAPDGRAARQRGAEW